MLTRRELLGTMAGATVLPPVLGAADKPPPKVDAHGDPLPEGAVARLGAVSLRHLGPVACMTWMRDGKILVTAGHDGSIRGWDSATGRQVFRFSPACNNPLTLALSRDGRLLAVGGGNGIVQVWDMQQRKEFRRFDAHRSSVPAVRFSSQEDVLATGSTDGRVRLWDVTTGELKAQIIHKTALASLEFSRDGKFLFSGDDPPEETAPISVEG